MCGQRVYKREMGYNEGVGSSKDYGYTKVLVEGGKDIRAVYR